MSLSHDLPVLVAPRPVRLTSAFAFTRPARIHSASPSRVDNDNNSDHSSQSPSPLSGRSSALPSEALEEFLSILKPSFFPSTSPTLGKARRSLTIPTFHQYERPLALRPRQRLEQAQTPKFDVEDASDSHTSASTSPATVGGEQLDSYIEHYDQDGPANWWLRFGPLSPVSRMHTRNPLTKQLTEHSAISTRAVSPAAVPLPTPTLEEWRMLQDA